MADVDTDVDIRTGRVSPAALAQHVLVGNREDPAKLDEKLRVEKLQRIAEAHISEIRSNPYLSSKGRADLVARLESAIASGDANALGLSIVNVVIAEKIEEADKETEELLDTLLGGRYGLNALEMERVHRMSRRIDLSNRSSIYQFAEGLVDPDMPSALHRQQADDLANHIQQHPENVAAWNKASDAAREEASAAYVGAQKDLKSLEADKRFPSAKETLVMADHLGLEADKEVQDLLRAAKAGKINDKDLSAKLLPHIEQQKAKVKAEMRDALEMMPENVRNLAHEIGDESAIIHAAIGALKKQKKNPGYHLTEKEEAAVRVFALSKNAVITKMLGDNALTIDRGISLDQGIGSIEQRTEKALKVIQNDMPPELANIPPKVLKRMVHETLEEADKRGVPVHKLDELDKPTLVSFSEIVTTDVRQQLAAERLRDSEARGQVSPAESLALAPSNPGGASSLFNVPLAPPVAAPEPTPAAESAPTLAAAAPEASAPEPAASPAVALASVDLSSVTSLTKLGVSGGIPVVEYGAPTVGGKAPGEPGVVLT